MKKENKVKDSHDEIKDCLKKLGQYVDQSQQDELELIAKYILSIEKQLDSVTKEFEEVRDIVSSLQTPTAKKTMQEGFMMMENRIISIKEKVVNSKNEMLRMLKNQINAFQEKAVVKTVNTFALKETLQHLQRSLKKTQGAMRSYHKRINKATKEIRSAKTGFKNVFRIMIGKESVKADYKRLNLLQKSMEGLCGSFDYMINKADKAIKKLDRIQKQSIKKELQEAKARQQYKQRHSKEIEMQR